MKLFIISVGKTSDPALQALTLPYQKRLKALGYQVELITIPSAAVPQPKKALLESTAIAKRLPRDGIVVLFDESGVSISTKQLAGQLTQWRLSARPVCLVIGGSYGVSDEFKKRANSVLKLSELTLPHQLVRLLLFEQLYRVADLNNGGNYHHE